jgi:hypothetical protein
MSDRELRARLEALQGAIKTAQEALAAPDPDELVAELGALTADAESSEAAAGRAEHEATDARRGSEQLREEVERREQSELAPRATRAVPVIATLLTVAAVPLALAGWVALFQLPRIPLVMWPAQALAATALLPAAWIIKRRLTRPRQGK